MSADSDWEQYAVTVTGTSSGSQLMRVTYGGGAWHGTGEIETAGAPPTRYFASATTDDPTSWTLAKGDVDGGYLDTTGYLSYINTTALAYGDGVLVASGIGITSPVFYWLLVCEDPGSDVWASSSWTPTVAFDSLEFADNQWVGYFNGKVYGATDPTGTWTLKHDFTAGGTIGLVGSVARYLDGRWVTAHRLSTGYTEVWSADDPAGTWTQRGSFPTADAPTNLGLGPDGYWVFAAESLNTYDKLFYRPTLTTGSWTAAYDFDAAITDYSSYATMLEFAYGDQYVAIVGADYGLRAYTAESITGPFFRSDIEVSPPTVPIVGGPGWNGDEWVLPGTSADQANDSRAFAWAPEAAGYGWGLLL